MDSLRVVPAMSQEDTLWLEDLWRASWGGVIMVSRGRVHRLSELSALIAWDDTERAGAATFLIEDDQAELTSIEALQPGRGVGSVLLNGVETKARAAGARRLWLITTNDNLDALRFYQRRGFRLAAIHRGAVDEARTIKPTIPEIGEYGIHIHDELELEKWLR